MSDTRKRDLNNLKSEEEREVMWMSTAKEDDAHKEGEKKVMVSSQWDIGGFGWYLMSYSSLQADKITLAAL